MIKGKWYIDKYNVYYQIKRILFKRKTKFQNIKIFDFVDYGKGLVIDDITQSSEKDEFIYHECLIHPALILQPINKKLDILVLGAGEGATLRELLKYRNINKITVIDIDEEAVKIFKKFFSMMHQNSFNNPKINLIIDSAENFLYNTNRKYDIIFSDITDMSFFNLGAKIKKSQYDFYKKIYTKLKKKGIFVTHAGDFSEIDYKIHFRFKKLLERIFLKVFSYRAYIPFFDDPCGFLIGSNDKKFNPNKISFSAIQNKIKKHKLEKKLQYLNPETYKAIFALPQFFKNN